MASEKKKNDQTLLALGIAITLPMILVSGPLAGYLIARYILVKYLSVPSLCIPILVALGFVASGMQAYRLIQRIKEFDSKND